MSGMHNNHPRTDILGVNVSAINLDEAVHLMASWIENRIQHYVNVCTVHTVMECHYNPQLREIVNRSGMSTPDGMPLVWLCRYHGNKKVVRVYGPDLMLAFCKYSVARGCRHFF